MTEAALEQSLAGSLFVIKNCGFRGMETNFFDYKKENKTA